MIQRLNIAVGLTALLAVLGTPPHLLAQSGAGTIQGTVQDATSSAIPAASVQAFNQATGVAIESTSNAGGFYAIKGLTAGTYKVSFSAPGMKTSENNVTLQNGQVLVLNRQLTIGEVSEKVTVSGETIQLATYDSGTVNTQLDAARISSTPSERTECARFGAEHGPWDGRGRHACQWPDGRSDGILARRCPDDQP